MNKSRLKISLKTLNIHGWHVTTAIHNSRYSARMYDNHVKMDVPIWLNEKDEFVITESIVGIVEDDKLNVLEYNICGDHMHLLLICEKEKLPAIVGKLKAVSARKCNIERGVTIPASSSSSSSSSSSRHSTRGPVPLSEKKKYTPLWTQKFGKRKITSEQDLKNVIAYIKNNREKHGLPANKRTRSLAKRMFCSYEHAVRTIQQGDLAPCRIKKIKKI